MLTDSFDIPIEATPEAQTVDELYDEAWELIALNIRKLAKGKASQAILEGYLDETKNDGAGRSTATELSFSFTSPGGACDVQMQVCAHWFEVARTLAHVQLAKIGERLGYVVKKPKKTAQQLVDTPREVPFFPHGEAVLAVSRGKTPMIESDDDGEVEIDEAELPASKKKLAPALAKSGLCACSVCESVRKGAKPVAPKPKKQKPPVEREWFQSLPKAMRSPDRVDSLTISKQKLKELPADIDKLAHVTTIEARDNWLQEVPPALFRIRTLERLFLGRNPLRAIPETLCQATKLKALDLSRTRIAALPDCFGNLPDLEQLDLDETAIAALPPSIVTLAKLESLTLDKCRSLKEPIPDLGALTALESLSLAELGEAQIRRIDFSRLTRLKRLILSGNGLTEVPPGIETLTELTHLELRENALTDLPDGFAALTSLEYISLWKNQLTHLPRALTAMPKLTRLELSAPIASLDGIGGCKKVEYVFVPSARLTSLPDDIGDMESLERLDVSDSSITTLPASMARLRTLKQLELTRTKLAELPSWIGDLTSLELLDISGTTVSKLPDALFELPNLNTLRVSDHLDEATLAKIKATKRIRLP
jgi:Leucine-rich repeat (LRR) protein